MIKKIFLTILLFLFFVPGAFSQHADRYRLAQQVSYFVHSIGDMKGYPLKDIIDTFKSQQYDEIAMSYAIYSWIGQNIDYDCKAFHHPKQASSSASAALIHRSATCGGYAALFKSMCDLARIQCVIIDGYAKANPSSIGKLKDRNKHSWNAVNIDNTWYYIDATWAAGYTDKKSRNFTKDFTDAWFFTNSKLFLLSHFPNDKKWQFTDDKINKAYFTNAPIVAPVAIICEIFPIAGMRGTIKAKTKNCKRIIFEMSKPDKVHKVDLMVKENISPAEYYIQGHKLSIDIPFVKSGNYPVVVYINNKPAYSFKAQVSKENKKRDEFLLIPFLL